MAWTKDFAPCSTVQCTRPLLYPMKCHPVGSSEYFSVMLNALLLPAWSDWLVQEVWEGTLQTIAWHLIRQFGVSPDSVCCCCLAEAHGWTWTWRDQHGHCRAAVVAQEISWLLIWSVWCRMSSCQAHYSFSAHLHLLSQCSAYKNVVTPHTIAVHVNTLK